VAGHEAVVSVPPRLHAQLSHVLYLHTLQPYHSAHALYTHTTYRRITVHTRSQLHSMHSVHSCTDARALPSVSTLGVCGGAAGLCAPRTPHAPPPLTPASSATIAPWTTPTTTWALRGRSALTKQPTRRGCASTCDGSGARSASASASARSASARASAHAASRARSASPSLAARADGAPPTRTSRAATSEQPSQPTAPSRRQRSRAPAPTDRRCRSPEMSMWVVAAPWTAPRAPRTSSKRLHAPKRPLCSCPVRPTRTAAYPYDQRGSLTGPPFPLSIT
jgi:hypothetical protein